MKERIKRESYLIFAKSLKPRENELIREFQNWLPRDIIDCHTHCNLKEHFQHIEVRAFNHMLSTFPYFTLKESDHWNKLLHPEKRIRTLRFPQVFRGIDHKSANLYLLEKSPEKDRVAIFGINDDIEYTNKMLNHPQVSALKMYHSYSNPPAQKIYQFFPKEVLRVAQDNCIPIILHLPLTIINCFEQIQILINDFPDLKICLVHLGLTKSFSIEFEKILKILKPYPNIFFDTAAVPSFPVVETAIKTIGYDRIMYGSDAPINLIRSQAYEHPTKGRRLATNFPYHWSNKEEQKNYGCLAKNATHDHWPPLLAIKKSLDGFPEKNQERIKKKIFFENAKIFYNF